MPTPPASLGQKKAGVDPASLRPKPVPLAFDVRWRQNHSGGDTSHRFRVDEYDNVQDAADAAAEFDRKVRRFKRENGGFAMRWQVLGGASSPDGLMLYADYLRGMFLDYLLTDCSPNTQNTYSIAIEKRILNVPTIVVGADGRNRRTYEPSTLGMTPLNQITSAMVVAWRQDLLRRGAGKRAVEIAMEVIRSSFSYAVENLELLTSSPVHKPTKKRRHRRKKNHRPINPNRVVDPEVIETIRVGFIARGRIRNALAVSLLAYLGFRISEVLPRTWGDFLDEKGVAFEFLVLETTVSGTVIRTELKDGADHRLVKVFKPVREEIEQVYALLGRPALDERIVIFEQGDGDLVTSTNLRTRIKNAQRRWRVNFRVQDLRHTCASLLGGGGDEEYGRPWTFTEIGSQLGHSPDVCASRYSHVVRSAKYRGIPIEQVIALARHHAEDAERLRQERAEAVRAELAAARDEKRELAEAERQRIRQTLGYLPRRTWRPSSGEARRINTQDLIDAGLLNTGERLLGRGYDREWEATVEHAGTIRLADGRTFATPTAAATGAGSRPRNGWEFWRVMRAGSLVTIASLRAQLTD
jgi:integrase